MTPKRGYWRKRGHGRFVLTSTLDGKLFIEEDCKLLQKIIRSKGGKMDMASLMGGIKDRISREFLVMQTFQLEKTWVHLS